ncbi:hypothetical protein PL75_03295 [Neisseria arctica]|uniref:Uncharacterized protein n=2 Tax=Neisseria arctica TaxID=1470200 RepID=A0A0J0YT19_9NEIS|nr:hypothetical protein PL75_03295 [Neisseria arctica]
MGERMKRMALNLKIDQHIILPSGRAARVRYIFADAVLLEYLDNKERLQLSRLFAVKHWGV